MRTLLVIVILVLTVTPGLAFADVVDPEPDSCPPGSTPATAHSGPYCAPTAECSADSDCSAGTCMEVMQCVETRGCGGLMPPDAAPCTLDHVVGPCASDGTCAVGVCRTRHVCSSGASTSGGCGCRAAGGGSPAGALALAPLALLYFFRRR